MWVFYISLTLFWNVCQLKQTILLKKRCCQCDDCVKTMNIQYHMITGAGHTETPGEMRRVHGLTNSAFIQLYVNELADVFHVFNIECKHGGNIKVFLPLWDKLITVKSRKYTRLNWTKCLFAFVGEKTWDSHLPCNLRVYVISCSFLS